MAPEIHAHKPYSGTSVDLFASAIILFIMFTGTPPFSKATPMDPYYRLLINEKYETFWNAHSRSKPTKDFFSESFKDFMQRALAFDPEKRLNLEQVKAHPWFLGNFTGQDQIRLEFINRKKVVVQELEKERLKKELEKKKKKPGDMLFTGNSGFRGIEELSEDITFGIENEYPELKLQKQIQKKVGETNANDILTVIDKDYLMKYLTVVSKPNFNEVKVSSKQYKVQFTKLD